MLKGTIGLFDRLGRDGIVALLYHRVGGDTASSVDLPLELYARQMAAVSSLAASLESSLSSLQHPSAHVDGRVVVTFDDGTADFIDQALPVLVEHGIPATVYLATEFIEEQRAFPGDGPPLSWQGAREALSTGLVTFGSHSHSHCLFDRISAAAAAEELDRSKGLIEDRLGVPCEHFAYPKALLGSPAVESEVRQRFVSAAIARCRPNRPGATDLHRLTRSPIQVADGMKYFHKKVKGGMALESDIRDLVNRWRYRHAVH